jgi:hypothetical protein
MCGHVRLLTRTLRTLAEPASSSSPEACAVRPASKSPNVARNLDTLCSTEKPTVECTLSKL